MRADFSVVLDACVLLPMPLADTLLRLAEAPRFYLPKWSDSIMDEVSRNLQRNLGKTKAQAEYRESKMNQAFPEALVEGYEHLVDSMTNHPKDRHVLAVAVRSKSELIVTYNKKDFPPQSTERWGVQIKGPSSFLKDLYDLDPGVFSYRLSEQAGRLGLSIEDLLLRLRVNVPAFVDFYGLEIGTQLDLPVYRKPGASGAQSG